MAEDVDISFKLTASQAVKVLKQLDKGVKKVDKSTQKMGKSFRVLKSLPGVAALSGLLSGGVLLRGIRANEKSAFSFEEAMARVNTVLKVGKSDLKVYADEVRALSKSFGLDADALANGLFTIVSAQAKGEKAFDILRKAAEGAVAGMAPVEVIAKGLGAAVNNFGVNATEALDALAFANDKGQITFSEIATAIGTAGGVAKESNLSLGEFVSTLAQLTGGALGSAESATQLKGVLKSLNSLDFKKILGFDVKNIGIADAVERLARRIQEERDKGDADFFQKVVTEETAFAGLVQLQNQTSAVFGETVKASKNMSNFSDAALDRMRTLAFEERKALRTVDDVFRSIGQVTGPTTVAFLKQFGDALEKNKNILLGVAKGGSLVAQSLPDAILKGISAVFPAFGGVALALQTGILTAKPIGDAKESSAENTSAPKTSSKTNDSNFGKKDNGDEGMKMVADKLDEVIIVLGKQERKL